MAMGEVFLLRNYESQWGESPGDKLAFFRQGTMVGGELVVNLAQEIEKGTKVWAMPLVAYTTDATTGAITVSNAVGATAEVTALIVVNAPDLAPISQRFGG